MARKGITAKGALLFGLGALIGFGSTFLRAQPATFDQYFKETAQVELKVPPGFQISEARVSKVGNIYLRCNRNREILKFSADGEMLLSMDLTKAVESIGAGVSGFNFQPDFDFDEQENIYLLGTWQSDHHYHAGAFEFSRDGSFLHKVELVPAVEAYRLSVTTDSGLLISGFDPEIVRRPKDPIYLMHLYSQEGKLQKHLVEYPSSFVQEAVAGGTAAQAVDVVSRELERGVIRRDMDNHVLLTQSYSRRISWLDPTWKERTARVAAEMSAAGQSPRAPSLAAQSSGHDVLWSIAATSKGLIVAELVRSIYPSPNQVFKNRCFRVLDSTGRMQTPLFEDLTGGRVLIGSDGTGLVYFMRRTSPQKYFVEKYYFVQETPTQ